MLCISGMSIVSFIIKHTNFSGRNVMLRSVSDRIDGGARASVCGRSGRFCQVCVFFPRKPICCTDVGGIGVWDGGQFVDINSGRESTLFGQNTIHV